MYRVVPALFCALCLCAQSPESPQEILKRAVDEQQSGNLDAAIADYRVLIQRYPQIPEIRSNLGAALASKGQYSEAVTEYNRALKLRPNPQVRLNLALAYYKLGDLSHAVSRLQQVRSEQPSNIQAITLLADSYLQLGQNKQVIDLLDSLQRENPDNSAYNYLLGTALIRDGQIAKGQLIIDRILRNGDSGEARLLMGTTKYMVSDFAGALQDFQKAVELNPNLPDVYSYYGLAL
ncbi:MAG: tetratricopeptide repeat protein, partial [Acidobacteriaceae bacterium]|nr:tetratricopeptide repeat protein [Acidobacteriaceae bacterium]